jgi:pilus assembly protein Flp/PilA
MTMKDDMNHLLLKLHLTIQRLTGDIEGQDVVEYSLLVCLIALAAISGVRHVATAVTAIFSNVSTSLA